MNIRRLCKLSLSVIISTLFLVILTSQLAFSGFALAGKFGVLPYNFCKYSDNANPSCFSLTISDSASPTTANRGQNITYTINYANTSSVIVPNGIITSTIDTSKVTFVSCAGAVSCAQSSGTITWNLSNLPKSGDSGATGSVSYIAQIKNTTTGSITSTATIDGDYVDPVTSSPTTTTVTLQNPVAANDAVSTNSGTPVNINVLANDTDADGTITTSPCSIVISTAASHGTATVKTSDCTIDYTPNGGYVGNDTLQYTIKDNDYPTTSASNPATVTITVNGGSSMSITKVVSPNTSVLAGTNLTYSITYTNTGSTNLTGVLVADLIDTTKLNYVSCSNSCNQSGGVVTWNIGALSTGSSSTLTLVTSVKSGASGNIINSASVGSDQTPAVTSSSTNTPIIPPTYVLEIQKTSSNNKPTQGQNYTYNIQYRGTGNTATTTTVVTDTLDSTKVDYIAGSCSNSCSVSTVSGNTVLTWNIGTLTPNQTYNQLTFDVTAKSNAYGTVSNIAKINSAQVSLTNSNEVQSQIQLPDNQKPQVAGVSNVNTTTPGNPVDFTYTYRNNSPAALTGITLTVVIPSDMEYVLGSCNGCSFNTGITPAAAGNNGTLVWNVAPLGPFLTGTINFQLRAKSNLNTFINPLNVSVVANLSSDQSQIYTTSDTVGITINPIISSLPRTGGSYQVTFGLMVLAAVAIILGLSYGSYHYLLYRKHVIISKKPQKS